LGFRQKLLTNSDHFSFWNCYPIRPFLILLSYQSNGSVPFNLIFQGCNVSKEVIAEQREEDAARMREERLAAIDARTAASDKRGAAKGPGKLSANIKNASTAPTETPPRNLNWN
jgi:hypothetical protein